MPSKHTKYICARCGNPVGSWYYGWKHQAGWHSPPSCGQKPLVVPRTGVEPALPA